MSDDPHPPPDDAPRCACKPGAPAPSRDCQIHQWSDEGQTLTPPPLTPEQESVLKDKALVHSLRQEDLAWRPNVYEGMFSHLEIAEGEVWAMNEATVALRSLTWLAPLFSVVVPDGRIALDLNEDGYSEVQIACRCGAIHHIEVGSIIMADCDRAFYWFGNEVRVANIAEKPDPPTQVVH